VSKVARDAQVRSLLSGLFEKAQKQPTTLDPRTKTAVEELFTTTSWGFREIVLVVVVARLLDPSYRASTGLYDCNPRALYEGPMVEELRARNIPHRKSGPLNIAKAARGLTREWAAQRRPVAVANRVVQLVQHIESLDQKALRDFAVALCARFLQESKRVASLTVVSKPEADPATLARLSDGLIEQAPDGGNTAQRISGLLLRAYHDELQTGIVVGGYEHRASVTSTTSKKPGDITEELPDGAVVLVYEVTTKRFNEQRVRESYDTVRAFDNRVGAQTDEVLVLCGSEDVHGSADRKRADSLYLGKLEYNDLTYYFYNLTAWIRARLAAMPSDARLAFHEQLREYVDDYNTSETVKRVWASLRRG
jgi:hypothetical protein